MSITERDVEQGDARDERADAQRQPELTERAVVVQTSREKGHVGLRLPLDHLRHHPGLHLETLLVGQPAARSRVDLGGTSEVVDFKRREQR